jgi:hypothetical protein
MTNAMRRRIKVKGGRGNLTGKVDANTAVDRYLCSATYLAPRFAGYVLSSLVEPSVQAASPACGVDLVALARHAKAARARVTTLRLSMAGALAVALLIALAAVGDQSFVLGLLAVLVGMAGVFVAVLVERLRLYRVLGHLVAPQVPIRDLAPALPPETEKLLEELNTSNVVVFEGGDAFVAWGRRLRDAWQVSLDATKPATDSTGRKRTVVPFTPVDLHKAVTLAVRSAGVPNVEVHNRLFVAGTSTATVPGLLPDPFGRPAASVPSASVRLAIEQPRPDVRTYLCVEKTSWGGELAVNLYLRAALVSGDLFIECHAHVLLPLREELTAIDHMPSGGAEVTLRALREALGAFTILRRVPGEVMRERGAGRRRRRAGAECRRAIRKNRPFNRGAGLSIRAAAAATERAYLFAYADEEMHLNALQRRILNAIATFLDQHGVDTADFNQKRTNIVNNHSYSIGAVNANQAVVGTGNTQNNQNNQAGQNNQSNQSDPAPWSVNP